MTNGIISKIKRIYICIVALIALLTLHLFGMFNQSIASDKIKEKKTFFDDGYIHEAPAVKYIGLSEPYLPQLLTIQKIHGTVRRAVDMKPVEGLMLKIFKPEMTALSDENGNFEFEIYNVYDRFDLNVYDSASVNILQVIKVNFKRVNSIDYVEHGSIVDEATVEVILQ